MVEIKKECPELKEKVLLIEKTENYQEDAPWGCVKSLIFLGLIFLVTFLIFRKIVLYPSTGYFFLDSLIMFFQCFALAIFVYLFLIILLHRFLASNETLQWHSCEHKTIALLKKKLPLTMENLRKVSRLNYFCGTTHFTLECLLLPFVVFGPSFYQFSCTLFDFPFNLYFIFVLFMMIMLFYPYFSCVVQYFFTTAEPSGEQLKEGLRLTNRLRSKIEENE